MSVTTGNNNISGTFVILPALNIPSNKLFSYPLSIIFQWVQYNILGQIVSLFGIGSNIINIVCFAKQGFKDPVNVNFLALALADIGCLVPILWTNLCFNPEFMALDLPFVPLDVMYLTGAIPHTTFVRISSWITAFITLERCLCIISPIKVKSLVTSKRVAILIACVALTLLLNSCPMYVIYGLGFKFYPDSNQTLVGMVYKDNRESVEQITFLINNVCTPFGAFAIIITCTIILVVQLHKRTNWRKTSSVSVQADNVSIRNQKVAKMVVMISVLFISCFAPLCFVFLAMCLEPELSIIGQYRDVFIILGGLGVLLESINSSSNIFIYYQMSSKYKIAISQLFFKA